MPDNQPLRLDVGTTAGREIRAAPSALNPCPRHSAKQMGPAGGHRARCRDAGLRRPFAAEPAITRPTLREQETWEIRAAMGSKRSLQVNRAEQQPLPATVLTMMMRTTAAHTNAVETSRTMVTARPRRPKLAGPPLLARPDCRRSSRIGAAIMRSKGFRVSIRPSLAACRNCKVGPRPACAVGSR